MDLTVISDNLGGIGLLAVVAWLIFSNWRRDRTGAAAQEDAAALALIKEYREERRETREEVGGLRERVAVLEDDKRRHAEVLQRHALWDSRAVALMQQQNTTASAALGDPPPLYPQGG